MPTADREREVWVQKQEIGGAFELIFFSVVWRVERGRKGEFVRRAHAVTAVCVFLIVRMLLRKDEGRGKRNWLASGL